MKKITVVLFLFINLLLAQNLDIGKMSNADLDKFKERLRQEEKFESDSPDTNFKSSSDVESLSVKIDKNETALSLYLKYNKYGLALFKENFLKLFNSNFIHGYIR